MADTMTAARNLAILAAAGVLALRWTLDLLAHVSRHRRYRRMYPAADRGRVWKHTR